MTNNIHVYINEPESLESYHINISDLHTITNGLCDSIIFQEMNYLHLEHIKPALDLLLQKLSYDGSCYIQFNNLEAIINDYNFNKIDEKKLNDILLNGRKNALTESTMLDFITASGFTVKSITYDMPLIKLELGKHG